MNEPIYKDCAHYHQHYILNEEGLLGVYCGHCTLHGAKRKLPQRPACPEYEQTADIRELFPSKKYVTKMLLAYLLSLEYPPQIHKDPSASR